MSFTPVDTTRPTQRRPERSEAGDAPLARRMVWGLFVSGLSIMSLGEMLVIWIMEHWFPGVRGAEGTAIGVGLLLVVTGGPVALVLRPMLRALRLQDAAVTRARLHLEAALDRRDFEARLHRALGMADAEPQVLRVIGRALHSIGGAQVELLLMDSSQAHLRPAIGQGPADGASPAPLGCSIERPKDCPALRAGRSLVFEDAEALDACPHLGTASSDRCVSCVPVSISNRSSGVLQALTPDRPAPEVIDHLEAVSTLGGARLGLLRAFEASERAASTDPLTGLLNRRSLEDAVYRLVADGRGFSVVMGDLDHFKKLNDSHGHAVGDKALKVFARTLQRWCRPDDLVARIGGEEFVAVLLDADANQAAHAVERLRPAVRQATLAAGLPAITASFGIAERGTDDSFDGLLRLADGALYTAKESGRDRAVIAHGCRESSGVNDGASVAAIRAEKSEPAQPQAPVRRVAAGSTT